jgi:hypothetical protein
MHLLQFLFYTIRHKFWVFYAGIFIVRDVPLWRLIVHDLSKYHPIEFFNGAIYYYGPDQIRYRENFRRAWLHHSQRNDHHWEYWVVRSPHKWSDGPMRMPHAAVREMAADILGASRAKTGNWDATNFLCSMMPSWNIHPASRHEFLEIMHEVGITI